MTRFPADADKTIRSLLASRVSSAIRDLLQTKHLYQSLYVNCDFKKEIDPIVAEVAETAKHSTRNLAAQLLFGPWKSMAQIGHGLPISDPAAMSRGLHFTPPSAKLYCANCDRREAYNPVNCENVLEIGSAEPGSDSTKEGAIQIFVSLLQCQSCKALPEVFLIRRHGTKLTLTGRTPIEHVEVPKVIPRAVTSYYSGAVVAHQSGQTLAALFLERTLIEQFLRGQSRKKNLSADELIEEYMATLPDDFKSRFPSLSDLYAKLSATLHSANPSGPLFESVMTDLNTHFEARRLYKLP